MDESKEVVNRPVHKSTGGPYSIDSLLTMLNLILLHSRQYGAPLLLSVAVKYEKGNLRRQPMH